jgi:hypothetical protein
MSDVCDLVARFAINPRALRDAAAGRADEILTHLEACTSCMATLESGADAETVFEALACESKLLTEDDRQYLDRLVIADPAQDDERREAVILALIPGLGGQAREIAERYDPLQLYAATEGLSALLRRWQNDDQPSARAITMRPDGSATVKGAIVPASAVAMEVARFTNLWIRKGEVLFPSKEAVELARWLSQAVRDQRNLLRHFRAIVPSRPVGLVARDVLTLVSLSASERTDEPFQRWRPSRRERFEAFGFAQQVKKDQWTLATFDAALLDSAERCRPLIASLRRAAGMTVAFLAEMKLITHARVIGEPSTPAAFGPLAEEIAACRPVHVGAFRGVAFTPDSLQLTGLKGSIRADAERIAFPDV